MNSYTTLGSPPNAADDAIVRSFHRQLIEAWNRGDGAGFAAPFAENVDFVAFEGTHLQGRERIATFHQHIFDTVVKDTRLAGEVRFVRFVTPDVAVVHGTVEMMLPGRTDTLPSRDSMQLFVATKRQGQWHIETLLNARELTMERQFALDGLESLSAESQRQVTALIASLQVHDGSPGRPARAR